MLRAACLSIIAVAGAGIFVGCGGPEPTIIAKASLKDAMGVDVGKVSFTEKIGEPVTIKVSIATTSTMVMPGEHGMHIHAGKMCDAPMFMAAGGHWNPGNVMHGYPGVGEHHGGDLGNITLDGNRAGAMEMTTTEMTLLPGDMNKYINGLAIIFHANKDDGVTQMPPGNAGARLACGTIGP